MKKWVILLSFLILLVACTNNSSQDVVEEQPIENPIPETPTQVVEETKLESCGNSACEEGEACSPKTYQTVCLEDCGFKCPAKLVVTETSCTGACTQDEKTFTISNSAQIKLDIENLGELGSGKLDIKFKCNEKGNDMNKVQEDGGKIFGVAFSDDFEAGKTNIILKGKQLGGNKISYFLTLNGKPTRVKELECKINVFSENTINHKFDLMFKP